MSVRRPCPPAPSVPAAPPSLSHVLVSEVEHRLFVLQAALAGVAELCRGYHPTDSPVLPDFVMNVGAISEALVEQAIQCSADFDALVKAGGAR
jgi:hypothetical protein